MKLYDISVPIRPGMIVYEGDPDVHLERMNSIANGDVANVSRLDFGVHTGTHVDAPVHFIDGAPGSESLAPEALIGGAVVIDATSAVGDLDDRALEPLDIPEGAERALLKTSNSKPWARDSFSKDFVSLNGSGARYLIARGTRVVGIDFLSIGDPEAHQELLGAGVIPARGPRPARRRAGPVSADLPDAPPGRVGRRPRPRDPPHGMSRA